MNELRDPGFQHTLINDPAHSQSASTPTSICNMFGDIRAFHEKFGLMYDGAPRNLPDDLEAFRVGFMAEELGEYTTNDLTIIKKLVEVAKSGCILRPDDAPPPLAQQFDALIDLVYVALGTAYMQGFDFNEGWRRVHEANMKKVRALRAVDSARGSTYDVVKPPGWEAPSLTDLV
jgi:predicted HAD superfamily Cof-like phosphohydrolase